VKVLNMIRDAEMNICCNSQVNLLGALTRVHEMVDYGINVSIGQDDLDNFYYPSGRTILWSGRGPWPCRQFAYLVASSRYST